MNKWTPELIERYKADYPKYPNRQLAEKYGVTKQRIADINYRLKLSGKLHGNTGIKQKPRKPKESQNKPVLAPVIKKKPQPLTKRPEVRNEPKITRAEIRKERKAREEKKYASRPLDLSQKIAVRIDHRTIVFINPGQDVEQIKARYKKAS
jgi:hypothetical protein